MKLWLFLSAAGTALHFLYEWMPSPGTAVPGAVNESVWEHLKLLFVPGFLWAMYVAKDTAAAAAGLLTGLGVIAALYYTYTGALGVDVTAVDIGIFYAAAAAVVFTERKLRGRWRCRGLAAVGLTALGALFIWWTFFPPRLPLFCDPVSGGYGMMG